MNWHTLSLPLIVVSVLVYHLTQKSIPREANPFVLFASAYLSAALAACALLVLSGDFKKGSELLKGQNWFLVALIGLSAIGVELGFLYAYRTGWRISTTSVSTGAFTTISLMLIGSVWFKEQLSTLNIVGILLCLAGVACVNLR